MNAQEGKQAESRRSESDSIGDRELERRLTALETEKTNYAKREDIKDLKIWVYGSVFGGGFGLISLILLFLKLFFGK